MKAYRNWAAHMTQAEAEAMGARPGFYLVRGEARHYISERKDIARFEAVCDRVLSEKAGFDYWVDYSLGLDVNGRTAWLNIDQTDCFI